MLSDGSPANLGTYCPISLIGKSRKCEVISSDGKLTGGSSGLEGGQAGEEGGNYNEHEETCPGSRCIHYLDCGSGFTGGYSPPTLSKLHTQNVQFIVSQLYRKKALFPSLLTPLHFFKGSGEDLNYFQLHFSCQVSPHAETGRAEARLCLAYIHYVYSSGRLNIQQ